MEINIHFKGDAHYIKSGSFDELKVIIETPIINAIPVFSIINVDKIPTINPYSLTLLMPFKGKIFLKMFSLIYLLDLWLVFSKYEN